VADDLWGSYRRIRVEAVHEFSIEKMAEGGLCGSSRKWPERWSDPNNPFVPHFLFSVDGTHCAVFERQTTVMNRDEKRFGRKFSSAGVMHEVAIDVCHSRIVHIRGPFPAGRHDKAVFMEELMGKIPAGSTANALPTMDAGARRM